VADIFVRINSEGVKLNQSDFILTLMSVFWDDARALQTGTLAGPGHLASRSSSARETRTDRPIRMTGPPRGRLAGRSSIG
jgi:hypothetical protein